jgi:hypothetical protein
MAISIGGITLDSDSTPVVKVTYDYFKSKSGEILGGHTVFTITGTVSVSDSSGSSGSTVMKKLQSIRDIGTNTKCVPVNIPGYFNGQGKISNVNIEQGPDPTWVNQGAYSIELKTELANLPPNSLGITKDDAVSDISISESIEIGEDAHGFSFDGGQLSKSFVKFTNKVSVTCKPLCPTSGTPFSKALGVLRRVLKSGPQNEIFATYKTWRTLLQDRSLEMNSEGGVSFSATIILLPPSSSHNALIDLSFGHNQTYESRTENFTVSGNITGLAPIAWSDLVNLSDSCSASKLVGAESAFGYVSGKYSSLGSWAGQTLTLNEQPNCPGNNPNNSATQCGSSPFNTQINCVEPTNSTVSRNRTDGSISFTFEWASSEIDSGGCSSGGNRTEIIIDVEDPQPTLVEHVIVRYGTLIQNINCSTAKRVSGTLTITSSDGDSCPPPPGCNQGNADNLMTELDKYANDGNYYRTGYTETLSLNSYSLKIDLVKAC